MVASESESRIFILDLYSLLFSNLTSAMPARFIYPFIITDSFYTSALVAVATSDTSSKAFASSDISIDVIDYSNVTSSAIYDIINLHSTNTSSLYQEPVGDYITVQKVMTFEPGATVKSITFNLLNDDIPEDTEKFKVKALLSNNEYHGVDIIHTAKAAFVEGGILLTLVIDKNSNFLSVVSSTYLVVYVK